MSAIEFSSLLKQERARLRERHAVEHVGVAKESSTPLSRHAAPGMQVATQNVPVPVTSCSLWSSTILPIFTRNSMDNKHIVSEAPPTVWHLANFFTESECDMMIRCVDQAPSDSWVHLRGRKLINLGGTPVPLPDVMTPERLPVWVQCICDALVLADVFSKEAPPNHVLINDYAPGQGIDAHEDGPLYAAHVAVVSLGSIASFDFVTDDTERRSVCSLLVPPRGVLVFSADAYNKCKHRLY